MAKRKTPAAARMVVAGITNVETSVRVGQYPIEYEKVRFAFHGIADRVGGVGYNVASAVATLGVPVTLATTIGNDIIGESIAAALARVPGLGVEGVVRAHALSLRSVNLVEEGTGRAGFFTDLKESQEIEYPRDVADKVLAGAKLLHAANINWALALGRRARELGVTVSTDVHAIRSLDDDYNRRFLDIADIAFFSAERLEIPLEDAIRGCWNRHAVEVVVVGMGEKGAALGIKEAGSIAIYPPVPLRPVKNTTGAGDTLAAAFLSSWVQGFAPAECLLRGQIAAGYKIGEEGREGGLIPRELMEKEFEARRGVDTHAGGDAKRGIATRSQPARSRRP